MAGKRGGTGLEGISRLVIEPGIEMLRLVLAFVIPCDRNRLEARL